MICDICGNLIDIHYDKKGEAYWTEGHNALPVVDGRCCDKCNAEVVIPARIKKYMEE